MNEPKLSRTIASTATIKLASIPSLDLLYTPLEERFERLTRLGRRALSVPVAAVSLMIDGKQWFKSVAGWNISELAEGRTLSGWQGEDQELQVIRDMASDSRTMNHPLVSLPPRFRFYAGSRLLDQNGTPIGHFCVFDVKPREFSTGDEQCLIDLSALAQREFLSDRLSTVHAALTAKLGVARRESLMDPLTRLWNRRGVSVLLKTVFEKVDRDNQAVAVAVLDLDNFKGINDSHGHQIGDELLRKVATRLVGAVRGEDLTFRLGGDEFLVLMTDIDEQRARRIADRVRRAIVDTPITTRSGGLPMSVSVGLTIRAPRDPVSVEALLDRADQALMRSKAEGRNRVRLTS